MDLLWVGGGWRCDYYFLNHISYGRKLFSYLDTIKHINKCLFFKDVVWVTDLYGSPNGPITRKYHVFTMGIRVDAPIVHCDVTPIITSSFTYKTSSDEVPNNVPKCVTIVCSASSQLQVDIFIVIH